MELRQLVYFEAVVRHGGFTRAAQALRIAQPAVSAQIAKLERELDAPLLYRTTRRVLLTDAGELVLGRVRRILAEMDGLRDDTAELTGASGGRVWIGSIQAIDPFDLAGALAQFRRDRPAVTLELRTGGTAELVAALHAAELDLAIAPLVHGLPDRIATGVLFDDELVLITAPGHRMAGRGALAVSDLAEDPFACLSARSGLRRLLDRAAEQAATTVSVAFECSGPHQIRELVAHGLGVGLIARSVVQPPGPAVTTHAVSPEPIRRPVGLLWHRDRPPGPAVLACREHLLRRAVTAAGDPVG
ncbi:MAG: LysR family transcriptional regulator [Pseudonocardia sp.]|nr:LysR family transcriptional regulator [Pseudonocardia sp.]